MSEITDIRRADRVSRRQRLYLDGCEWRSVPTEIVRDLGLRVGQRHDATPLAERIVEAEPRHAWERALRLLDFRDRSTGELTRRLSDDAYGPEVVADVVARTVELGFVDDRRFAEGMVRALVAKRQGRRRIAVALAAKGIDGELATSAIDAAGGEEEEASRAVVLARSVAAACRRDPARIAKRLVGRGFEPSVAWRAAREVCSSPDMPADEG